MTGRKVTPAKLIAASRALIALSDCDDWEDRRDDDADAHGAEFDAHGWLDQDTTFWHLPNRLQLARMANTLSGMLDTVTQ